MTKKILSIVAISFLFACGTQETNSHNENNETEHHEEGNGATIIKEIEGYEVYGHNAEVTPEGAISSAIFATMLATLDLSKDYKVQILLNEVCKKMGCWSNFKTIGDETMMVYFKDHYTIPIASESKEAIIYGKIKTDTLTVEFQKHLLDDKKEAGEQVAQNEYDAITEPKFEKSFEAESILLKK